MGDKESEAAQEAEWRAVRAWGQMDRREGRRIRMSGNDALGRAIGDALWAACHPVDRDGTSVVAMAIPVAVGRRVFMTDAVPIPADVVGARAGLLDVDQLVAELFREEGASLVRLVRLFVDDRNAAEDLVQEAFHSPRPLGTPHQRSRRRHRPTCGRSC